MSRIQQFATHCVANLGKTHVRAVQFSTHCVGNLIGVQPSTDRGFCGKVQRRGWSGLIFGLGYRFFLP